MTYSLANKKIWITEHRETAGNPFEHRLVTEGGEVIKAGREDEAFLSDPTKVKEMRGWVPEITAQEMCAEMVVEDLKAVKRLKLLKAHGLDVPVSLEG